MAEPERSDPHLRQLVLRVTDAATIVGTEVVQSLWSGYGQIVRYFLAGGEVSSIVVKHVRYPGERDHPYGWTSDLSHERKVESYRVEANWYQTYAQQCGDTCAVPQCLAVETSDDATMIVLEDLDALGFAGRRQHVEHREIEACLSWLAHFHARFLGERAAGLWPVGTYWHLATRPDEFAALEAGPLKDAAASIDERLNTTRFQTFVHGDAKLANFCFNADGTRAAAVDFQYVGGGCGMKDVAYFISSCLDEDESEAMADEILDRYFALLRVGLERAGKPVDFAALEADWRALYPVAWTDFTRFLRGWSPGHWKLHHYSNRLTAEVLAQRETDTQ